MLTSRKSFFGTFFLVAWCLALQTPAGSGAPRAGAQTPRGSGDVRLGELRHLDLYFPFQQVENLQEWKLRSAQLRRQIQVATGLLPYPPRTPLKAVIHGQVRRIGYTVEKVYFESLPGHFVTGNLYRPSGSRARRPGVLSPHGHSGNSLRHHQNGRFHDHGANGIREEIATGAERFAVGGRHPLQARAVQLARMGCVVFQYDMVGYGDSLQLPHKGLGPRPAMNTLQEWGFSSPRAELHLQSLMMLQTWNSIRALDFLISLSDVDPERIAVEGHSGGGTQTFILAALDARLAVVFPAVMVSTSMQGGCICENACYLRIGAGNVDFAALSAPRPLGMTGANDWTRQIKTRGLPDLKQVYGFHGVPELVAAAVFPQFGHNYNSVSRTVMYRWLNRHLDLGFPESEIEQDYIPLTEEEMSVWNHEHPAPRGDSVGDSHERYLLAWLSHSSGQQMERMWPRDLESYREFRSTLGEAFDVILGRRLEEVGQVQSQGIEVGPNSSGRLENLAGSVRTHHWQRVLLSNRFSEEVRILTWSNPGRASRTLIWITGGGIGDLSAPDNEPRPAVKRLLEAGVQVISADLLGQGRHAGNGGFDRNRLLLNSDGSQGWHHHAAYTFGYNHPLFTQRVHDVLTIMSYVRSKWPRSRLELVGLGPVAGPIAAAARAQGGEALQRTAIDTGGFRFVDINQLDHSMFLPGAARYLDLPGLLLLPQRGGDLWLTGESADRLSRIRDAHRASGHAFELVTFQVAAHDPATSVVNWLLEE